jgi:DNA-binding response OmpR family regulator
MSISIIYVEDEIETAHIVELYLQKAGFKVSLYTNGDVASRAFNNLHFDLAILDINVPGTDGIALLKQASVKSIPTIMVTAKSAEPDKIFGLDSGADDYVCKPFSPNELVSRVKALIRRTYPTSVPRRLKFGDFCFDSKNRNLHNNKKKIELTSIEFDIFEILINKPERTYSRKELLDHISKENIDASERTIDTHILNLRKKIEVDRRNPLWIITVFGMGYKFNQAVKIC